MPTASLDDRARRLLGIAEKLAVALLLAAALVPRVRDLDGPWDREYEGFQGTFFTLCAVNYERLGLDAYGGYPALNVDLPEDREVLPYLYPNHPPAVPIVTWLGLRLLGPEDWSSAWQEGEPPPPGAERAARLPFLLAHMLALLALWWGVRSVGDPRAALLALGLAAAVPIQVLYATLVNYENLVWPPTLLGVAFQMRHLRSAKRADLLAAGACFFAGACVTFFPAFLVPGLVLQALWCRGFRTAFATGLVLSIGSLVPAMAHGAWVGRVLPAQEAGNVADRVKTMMGPMLGGDHPVTEWLRRQGVRLEEFYTLPYLLLALAGVAVVVVRALRSRRGQRHERPSPGLPLLVGGFLVMFLFYKHTWDGAGARDGQTVFLLNVAPGIVVLAAEALGALGRPLLRLRGGEGPLIALTLLFLLPALVRAEGIRGDWRSPGPFDDPPGEEGPDAPLPFTVGRQVAEILPAGAVGIYPQELAMNIAVSYYAWRTLIPATPAGYDLALMRIDSAYGLASAPRFILIPKSPPPYAAAAVATTRAIVDEQLEMLAESEHWELWPAIPASTPEEDG